MKTSNILICFFLLAAPRDGNSGLLGSDLLVRRATEGGSITVSCSFTFSGRKRFFCRDDCEGGNILIETEQDVAQNGRYGLEYKEGTFLVSSKLVYVSISELKRSDSGRYRCGLRGRFSDSSYDIEISVDAAVTSGPPSVPSASAPTPAHTSGSASRSAPRPTSRQQQRTPPAASVILKKFVPPTTGALLCVALILAVVVVALSVAVLIFCRKRTRTPREPRVQTEYVDVPEASQMYEEIGEEGRWSRAPAVGMTAVYTCTKHSKTNRSNTTDGDAGSPRRKTDALSGKLAFCEEDFSDGVSVEPPLYSALTLPQQ